eukprot:TRINITY_DN5970_c0_g1_i10.p1 TRINITY_DN5970_c0_g1~~TRINITY_DN5970_c0_g1_i10.p1  ORF type:complete len:439 (-),score=70.87 TRINITY_DN5970_c0_g1_i10:429-1676(-)
MYLNCRFSGVSVGLKTRQAQQFIGQRKSRVNVKVVSQQTAVSTDWETVAQELSTQSPLTIMDHALSSFGNDIAIAFSGAEDVALVEFAHLTGKPYRVFSLDTGRLNPETYKLFDDVERHYGIHIEYTFPETQEVIDLVRAKGMYSFYEDGHQECCRVRKVRPLRKQLKTLKAWITGQRKDQSPGTRSEVPVVQVDPVFEGEVGGPGSLIKYNPLTDMSSTEVWNFLRVMGVPTNKLHECGYVSIGCEPCTKAVLPNQHEREGRWWWEDATQKECGLHSGNISKDGKGDTGETQDLWVGTSVVPLSKDQLNALAQQQAGRDQNTLVALYAPWCQYSQGMEGSYAALAEEFKGSKNVQIAKFQADIERDFAESEFGLKSFPTVVLLPKKGGKFIKYPSERRDVDSFKMWLKAVAAEV